MFKNREDAANQLVPKLEKFKDHPDAIIIGLPRGGVVLSAIIAKELNLPMDIIVPRKIGSPFSEEFAIGAIGEKGERIINKNTVEQYNISQEHIDKTVKKEMKEARRRLSLYRQDRPPLDLTGKTAIIVDDGIATGSTMLAAVASAKTKKAERIVIAVPVAPPDTIDKLEDKVNEVICLETPIMFGAIGAFYETFGQVEDQEVINLMKDPEK